MKLKMLMTGMLLALTVSNVAAQTEEEAETSAKIYQMMMNSAIKKNWFIDVMGGGQIYFGDYDRQCTLGKRIAPALSAHVGLWFTPFTGARIGYQGLQIYGATKNYAPVYGTGEEVPGDWTVQRQKINFGTVNADVMFSLSNLIFGYNINRIYGLTGYIGAGYAWTYDKPDNHSVTGHVGLLNTFAISRVLDITVDISALFTNDPFDGETGGRWGEAMLSAQVGLAYTFAGKVKSTFHHDFNFGRVTSDLDRENSRLNAELASARNDKEVALAQAQKMTNAYNELLNQKDTVTVTKTVIQKIGYVSNFVTFPIGRADLSNEARLRLKMLADSINEGNKATKYVVTGFADKGTGSEATNSRLSQERAQVVYDFLVKEGGVSADQLQVDYKGGVENTYYNDPALSRSAFVLPIK